MTAFSFLVGVAVKSSAVLAMAWLVARFLRNRPAALRHLVWTAAAASVLALPLLSLVLPALRMPASGALSALVPNITFQAGATAGAAAASRSGLAVPQPMPAPAHSPVDWRLPLMLIWAAGALAGLAQMAVGGWVIAGARRRAGFHPAQAESVALAEAIGIGHRVDVLAAPAGSMPMTCGLLRPAIFLPADSVDWDAERRRVVLLHELAHVRRGDAGAHILARLALALNWWNPLAWLAWRESLKERERAADDLVLLAGERASAYAGHLLEVARALQSKPPVAWAALAMARRSQLEGRLLAILDPRVPRNSVARVSALATALLAIVTVAPFAAMRAQDQPAPQQTSPPRVEYTLRAAADYATLDRAARQLTAQKQYDSAQKLLEAALQLREKSGGRQSAEYCTGLMKLGELARVRKQDTEAAAFYQQAVAAVAGKPEAARPLTSLGVMMLAKKDYPKARDYFDQAQAADPDHKGMPLTWVALTYAREDGAAAQAESAFQQATAAEDPASPDAATTLELYAIFLKLQGRDSESDAVREKAVTLRKALGAQILAEARAPGVGSGVYKVGGGISAPSVLIKGEPMYSEDARVAKYMGMVVLSVEIGTDGAPHNIRVVRGLGLGLSDAAVDAVSQWKFKPGTRDGVPVTVAATIEVNFRLE
jgi:TonB family protein